MTLKLRIDINKRENNSVSMFRAKTTSIPTTIRVSTGVILGNIIEWYCFTLFAQFSAMYLPQFFPGESSSSINLIRASLFAAAFLLRPIGGIIFSHYGDQYGRLQALLGSVLLMLIPTFLIGILPGYSQIGLPAGVLLILFRMAQGLSVGGQFPGSFVFSVEFAEPHQKGIIGSHCFSGAKAGMLLAALAFTFVNFWGSSSSSLWRIPFLISGLFAIMGYYIKQSLSESQVFIKLQLQQNTSRSPLKEAIKNHKTKLLLAFGLCAGAACSIYQMYICLYSYLIDTLHYTGSSAANIVDFGLIFLVIFIIAAGFVSDIIGRRIVVLCGAIGLMVLAHPLYYLYGQHNLPLIYIGEILLSIVSGCVIGPLPALLVELFPIGIRYSAISLSYNFSFLLFGGLVPFAGLLLMRVTHNVMSPYWFLFFSGGVSLASVSLWMVVDGLMGNVHFPGLFTNTKT